MSGYSFFKRILMVLCLLVIMVLVQYLIKKDLLPRQTSYVILGVAVLGVLVNAISRGGVREMHVDFAQEQVVVLLRGQAKKCWETSFDQLQYRWDPAGELWLESDGQRSLRLHRGQGFTLRQLQAMQGTLQMVKDQYQHPRSGENETVQGN